MIKRLCFVVLWVMMGVAVGKPVAPKQRMTFPNWFAGIPVTTSPYLGEQSRFNMDDLLVMVPSVNEDLRLLYFRHHGEENLHHYRGAMLDKPYVKVSGKLAAQASMDHPVGMTRTNDLNLTTAELDVLMAVSPLVTGYFTLNYDSDAVVGDPVRVDNSRYFLDKGFFTLGNFKQSPFYATVGQMYVPFGRYSTAMNSGSLPSSLGKTRTRAMLLGYSSTPTGPYASMYLFRGNTVVNNDSAHVDEAGFNIDYVISKGDYYADLGVSGISNLAEANGMQNASGRFSGFGQSTATEALARRVPGANVHVLARYKKASVNVEYVGATRAFELNELRFNSVGAKPWAVNAELGYGFNYRGFAGNAAAGYGRTAQSLALGLPKERYVAALSTSLHQNTVQSVEFRHNKNYATTASASGAGGTVFNGTGGSENAVSLSLGIYF